MVQYLKSHRGTKPSDQLYTPFEDIGRWNEKKPDIAISAIELKEDFKPKKGKIYPLNPLQQNTLDEWIKEQLAKGYIQPSKSPQASPFFFVEKKDAKKL